MIVNGTPNLVVWDPELNKELCKFDKDGIYKTEDPIKLEKLAKHNYIDKKDIQKTQNKKTNSRKTTQKR